ncbi:hypothetical protein C7H19_21840 [Aphanothece hegewaldii CCALA 016]|uniref:Uncharacterized protein n=1 Tax=Aphanothece hegewaldii CCALA 016 TaxID=2107694 RepID=A0A2T1LS74_9CHRO|nr:hypothetical protein [Aphanothece hegewaldii]PSF32274.1 hypothetical protein C7H19_21840 [Aphanothece hegewaldii CCALA 016]
MTQSTKSQKLADALCSIKAVKKYQLDRQTYGANRVRLYVDDVDGDWLNNFDEKETSELEEHHLSKDLCES